MQRIRTVKPSFFTDARLYRMERDSGLPIRLAYEGLWTCCDREGRFVADEDELKARILPFDPVDFAQVMDVLVKGTRLVLYEVDGVRYGWIPKFTVHQFINGREGESVIPPPSAQNKATEPPKDPDPNASITRDPRENDALTTREAREGNANITRDSTSEEHEGDASHKERKEGRKESQQRDAREDSVLSLDEVAEQDSPPPWFQVDEDRLVRLICETALRIPKFSAHFAEFFTEPRVRKLVGDLRNSAPAEEAITFQLDNWETFNVNNPKKGGEKDGVAALRNWFKNDVARWALAKKNGGRRSSNTAQPSRETVRDASSRRRAQFGIEGP